MFQLSNGKTYERLNIISFGTLLGYITKSDLGYTFTQVEEPSSLAHEVALFGLNSSWSSSQIADWMRTELTITSERGHREQCYPSWCRTVDDEVSVYRYFPDYTPLREVYYE